MAEHVEEPTSKWSWRLGHVSGIAIKMHATFLLLIAWIALSNWAQGAVAVVIGIVFILALFACVVLHELGHALTAQRFGIKTRDITLLPIGGIARLERMPDDPKQELLVALAGPAVNVLIAAVLFAATRAFGDVYVFQPLANARAGFFGTLMGVNIFLVLFNMLPAFPMDGGRVVRALLATRMDYVRATQIAAGLGQAMAFLFGFVGLFYNPILVLIAVFVWAGAAQELSMVQLRTNLRDIRVARAMLTDFRTLAPDDSLAHAVEALLAGSQQDFPVAENGHVLGVLTRRDLLLALAQQRRDARVAELMQADVPPAHPDDDLEGLLVRLQNPSSPAIPVVDGDRLVGLLTMDNVSELLMIRAALRQSPPRPEGPRARPIFARGPAHHGNHALKKSA
ncbi:MAG TPA: site-2 protease family protein [Phycisphaerae bacterium]